MHIQDIHTRPSSMVGRRLLIASLDSRRAIPSRPAVRLHGPILHSINHTISVAMAKTHLGPKNECPYSHGLISPRWATSQTTHRLYRREVAGQQRGRFGRKWRRVEETRRPQLALPTSLEMRIGISCILWSQFFSLDVKLGLACYVRSVRGCVV